ncbi:MAG: ankyrin repeat domain-containing protein [Desulfomonile tiedjei]|nr:ankyrin repeat domain-containing protein [Desulfomonile tiedjei]
MFSFALALFLAGALSLAADQPSQFDGSHPLPTGPVVNHRTVEEEQFTRSPMDAKSLFPATRYPFLPALVENRDLELCATIIKGARERFFSSDANPRMTGKAQDGITWLEWDKVEEGGLDLDGTGRMQAVVGRRCTWPGGMEGSEFFVFPSVGSFDKAVKEQAWSEKSQGCENSYRHVDNKWSPDAPVMYHPFGLLAGDDRKKIDTGEDSYGHRLFHWRSRYYFFAEPPPDRDLNTTRLTTFRLQADGKVDPRCVVCLSPHKSLVQNFRRIPGISPFLKVLSTIGNQGERCRACSDHEGGANAAVDRAAFRPWAVSRATPETWCSSYFRYDHRMKRFLEDWSFLEVWNRREYQTFLQHIDPAVAALEKYYVSAFGLAREEGKKAAQRVIEEVIAAWLLVPHGYDPERDLYELRRPPLNRPIFDRDQEALKEALRKEKERSPDGSRDKNQPNYSDASSLFSIDRKRPDIEISLALHEAVEWEEGMRLLLEAEADPNAGNGFGKTPLMTAAHMNRPDTVRLLLSQGADPNRKTVEMKSWTGDSPIRRTARTPLMYAAENAGTEVMKLLLDAGASSDERDSNGDGIGHYLARNPRLTEAEKRLDIRELVRSRSRRSIGPSVDCNEAKSQVEKAVCRDEVLKMFDGEMADAFSRWMRFAGYEARNDQRQWLKERETSCTEKNEKLDVGCLQDKTRSRVRYLHNRLAESALNDGKPPTDGDMMSDGRHDDPRVTNQDCR